MSGTSIAPSPLPPPWGFALPPLTGGGGPTPAYPILTEEVGYPPSPLANGTGTATRPSSGGRGSSLGPVVTKALQDVLGWKVKSGDSAGFVGALNQSFQLSVVQGAVVSKWTPRSYAVQSDLSGGITGAQASIYTMAKTLLNQALPLIDGLTPLDPSADVEDVAAMKQLTASQLTNLTDELAYLGGPRVMRVQQYFQMLFGVTLNLDLPAAPAPASIVTATQYPSIGSPLGGLFGTSAGSPGPLGYWPPIGMPPQWTYWTDPDYVLGSLGDLRDELGLFETIGPSFVNTVDDEQNVTNFRILVDYANSLLNAWTNSIRFFAGMTSPFLGTQLVIISRQLGVIAETVDEVRFVLDSVFMGPSERETLQVVFPPGLNLPPIYLEDLLLWMQSFVGEEAQGMIQGAGKLGLGEDFINMIYQLCTQAYGLYLFAQSQAPQAVGTTRVQQSMQKLANQLWALYQAAFPVSTAYVAPRQ